MAFIWNHYCKTFSFSYFFCFLFLFVSPQVNISLVVNDNEAEQCVRALHKAFFECELSELETECISKNGSVPALS